MKELAQNLLITSVKIMKIAIALAVLSACSYFPMKRIGLRQKSNPTLTSFVENIEILA